MCLYKQKMSERIYTTLITLVNFLERGKILVLKLVGKSGFIILKCIKLIKLQHFMDISEFDIL
jgi:hypothetical protein